MRMPQQAPDPFAEPPPPPRPEGLTRDHSWYPSQAAVDTASSRPRYMDIDDNIDRYLTKMSESGRRPQSRQWLRWLIEDDAGSRERERIALQVQSLVHDDGTPTTWTV